MITNTPGAIRNALDMYENFYRFGLVDKPWAHLTKPMQQFWQKEFDNYIADHIVRTMNNLLQCDPEAISKLSFSRVSCNEKITHHPTAQVVINNGNSEIGLLGVLNAIVGCNENSQGYLNVIVDENDNISEFLNGRRPCIDVTPG